MENKEHRQLVTMLGQSVKLRLGRVTCETVSNYVLLSRHQNVG
jgi:hypothetical protein